MAHLELHINGIVWHTCTVHIPSYSKLKFEYRCKARATFLNNKVNEFIGEHIEQLVGNSYQVYLLIKSNKIQNLNNKKCQH